MTDHVQRVIARASAIDFVLLHGHAIDPDGGRLTDLFTEVLIRFERETSPIWSRLDRFGKLDIAFGTARWVLADLLPGYARWLDGTERFKWHQRFCRLILDYMTERSHCGPGRPVSANPSPYTFSLN